MGPLKRVDVHTVPRRFDFSRRTGTGLGQNQWLCPKPKKTVGSSKLTNPNDSTPKRSMQRSIARKCVTHPAEEMSEITGPEHLSFRPCFQIHWVGYATHQCTGGTYCWVWTWPSQKAHIIVVLTHNRVEKIRLAGLRATDRLNSRLLLVDQTSDWNQSTRRLEAVAW